MVKNLPSNTADTGSIPGRGTKITHAVGQRSLRAATTKSTCSGARVQQGKIPKATIKTRCSQIKNK